jgi:two-component system response regulator RegX3
LDNILTIMKKILVCEDEQNIREFVVINLQRAGYETIEAGSGDEAVALYEKCNGDVDIAILDIMLPGRLDGLAVCKELRHRSDSIGIILLTARTQEMDKVTGLMSGADDYVTKPFSPSELVARVDAVYRRVSQSSNKKNGTFQEEVRSGEFVLNLRSRAFSKNGVLIELTQVEFQIMEYFFTNPDIALSRLDILKHVWGSSYSGEEKIVDVNIRRLRMKIEDEPSNPAHIITVWGLGYRWEV